MVASGSEKIRYGDGVSVLEGLVEDEPVPEAFSGIGLCVDGDGGAVHGFDGGEESFTAGEFSVADLAGPLVGELAFFPCTRALSEEEDAFLCGGQDFLFGVFIPVDGVEVVAGVGEIGDDAEGPRVFGIRGHAVRKNFAAFAGVVLVPPSVEGLDDQVPLSGRRLDPMHAMDSGFVVEFDGFPALGAVSWGDEIEHATALFGIGGLTWVPLGANRDFGFAVTVDVLGGDADVVAFGEIFADDVLCPRGVLVPLNRSLIGEENVGFAVAVDVCDRDAVTDADRGVDVLGFEARFGSCVKGGCEESDCGWNREGQGGVHETT